MKRLLFMACLTAVSLSMSAQQVLKGKVTDEKSVPLEFVNVVLLSLPDSAFVQGTITNQAGVFTLPTNQSEGLVRFSAIGYGTVYKPSSASELRTVTMTTDAQMLGEVVVKGNLPRTRLKGDAMVTNIQNTVLSKSGTAIDVLKRLPGVMKSGENSVSVLGRGTPEIYINGRKVRSSSELDQLSSDNIKAVEVVTNPGARYAATVRAVIRIETKKRIGDGFSLNNRTYAKYNKDWSYGEQFNFNYRRGGFDWFGMLFYSDGRSWSGYHALQKTFLDKTWTQDFASKQKEHFQKFTANAGMNYVFNPKHSLGLTYRFSRVPKYNGTAHMVAKLDNGDSFSENSIADSYENQQSSQHSLNTYYNGKAGDWNIDFNADAVWKKQNNNSLSIDDFKNASGTAESQNVTSVSGSQAALYAGKLVFTHPLLGGQFSFGGEYSHTHRTNGYVNPEGILKDDNNKINEGTTALFAEYTREFGKLTVQAGVRYENVGFDYYQNNVLQEEQSKTYNNVFPTLALSMPVGKVDFQLSYAGNISRPSYHQLRSNISYANKYTYETGNPFLLPTLIQKVDLNIVYKWFLFGLQYSHVKDDIIFTSDAYNQEDPTIALFALRNAEAYDNIQTFVVLSPTIGCWSPQFTTGVFKQWYKINAPDGPTKLNTPTYIVRWNNSIELPAKFTLNVDLGWSSKSQMVSKSYRTSWGVDMSIYKEVIKKKLTLLLQGNDIFLTQRSSTYQIFNSMRTMSQSYTPNSRSVTLTMRYKFNSARSKYKGTSAGSENINRL